MPTTLTYASTTLTLSDETEWVDEFAWQPVVQRTEFTVTGALVVDAAAKQAGEQVTLDCGWLDYADVQTLASWRAIPAQTFSLFYRGVAHTVVFDQERNALETRSVAGYAEPDAADRWNVVLRFLKV